MNTKQQHPEDRIYHDRNFIRGLNEVAFEKLFELAYDLNLKEDKIDFLFDYVFNYDGEDLSFEEYLESVGQDWEDIYE